MSPTPHPTAIALPGELRGARVVLRPYRADDAEQVFAAVDESRDHLRPWVNWVDDLLTTRDCRDYCIRCAATWSQRSDLSVGVFDASSGRYLGGSGLHDPDWELRSFEIGYWLRATALGNGYVTETVRLLVDFAFGHLQARSVSLTCDAENHSSRRVAERAGFVHEGMLRSAVLGRDGSARDWLQFSLVPSDFTHRAANSALGPGRSS